MSNEEIIAAEIEELERQPINYGNAEKLAYLYIVRDHIKSGNVGYKSNSEFSKVISDKNYLDVLSVMDELIETLSLLSPKLYKATINKLKSL